MNIKIAFLFILLGFASAEVMSQQVVYSQPDRSDVRQTNFEILGKVGGNVLIYKNLRDNHYMSVYDMQMNQLDKHKLEFFPDKVINTDFLAYPDFAYIFYQYQRRSVVYCMAAKIGETGEIVGKPMVLDTTSINFWASNKIYSVINSEDKQYITVVKINTKDDDNHLVTTVLFNKDLELQEKKFSNIRMPDRHERHFAGGPP